MLTVIWFLVDYVRFNLDLFQNASILRLWGKNVHWHGNASTSTCELPKVLFQIDHLTTHLRALNGTSFSGKFLTDWGRMTHMCVTKLTIISSSTSTCELPKVLFQTDHLTAQFRALNGTSISDKFLTDWGRMTHMCVTKLTIISSSTSTCELPEVLFQTDHLTTQFRALSGTYFSGKFLNHWGRMTHMRVSKLTSISSDNGLSPVQRQAII